MLKHTNEKPHACQICPKRFSRLQYMKEHMNMHTGARPYKCAHCDMAFADMSSCYKHRKAHSLKSNIRPVSLIANDAIKPDIVATSTPSPATNHVTNAPRLSSVSIVDLQKVENIISSANVQMVLPSGKKQITDEACITPATCITPSTCITPATSAEISELDKIVYETLLPNDLRVLSDETSPCNDTPCVFKHLSPEQATQLKLALAHGMKQVVPDATSAFSHPDSSLFGWTTVFIQELCNKSSDSPGILSHEQFTDSSCGAVVAMGTTEAETEATPDDIVAMKLEGGIPTDATNDAIVRGQPRPLCDTDIVGVATGVVNIAESVIVDHAVALTPVQLVGLESSQQYYLILSGSEQEQCEQDESVTS